MNNWRLWLWLAFCGGVIIEILLLHWEKLEGIFL